MFSGNKLHRKERVYSAPTCINLEITEACNIKCRHCYNPWREESAGSNSLTKEKLDYLISEFLDCGVFHVILSGGEPFAKFDLLEYGIRRMVDEGLSVSCNSNITMVTAEKIKRLKDAGLDHILASWYALDPKETDHITATDGSHQQVIDGIKIAVENGMRVSVNTICTNSNKGTIYESGKLLHELGVQQFIAHRVVPPAYDRDDDKQHRLKKEDSLFGLDELLRLKEDTGMAVGTLISYPLCLLGDLEKYADFVGRGCPTQSGHRFNINSNGETHGCVMEDKEYGDVFKIGLKKVFAKTLPWRNKSYYYKGCEGCDYIDVCQTGCRMDAFAATGEMNGKDPLFMGKEFIVKPFKHIQDPKVVESIKNGARITVPDRIRFRKEDGFHLLNIRWANTIEIEDDVAKFLKYYQNSGETFTIKEFGTDKAIELANLVYKDAVISEDIPIIVKKSGVSVDPAKLPS